jgi:acetyl esterase
VAHKSSDGLVLDQYIPEPSQRAEVHASPINALKQELTGLPQALLIVDENDVLHDEGEDYGRKLAEAGVRFTTHATTAPSMTSSC